jgi:O-antigen/teichoic acid export membrane protein
MAMISDFLRGQGLFARAMRGSAWTIVGFGASQGLRFGSNLILTRLLFPETFGMMALVTVAIVGFANFSDMGTGVAIAYNRRGDDPAFLDTAWTLHVFRGFLLWLGTCALALPFAHFYGEPMLAQLLPVAGLSFLIGGFYPTRVEQAQRHLHMGRLTRLDLVCQVIGTLLTILLAWWTGSIWGLVVGGVLTTVLRLGLILVMLPGHSNRFHIEPEARRDLIRFGQWIFFSTVCGFVVAQGDRLILGRYLSLDQLGIYNIGYFLASFPLMLAVSLTGRILIPLYRDCPPGASRQNFQRLQLMRIGLTGGVVAMLITMAFVGIPLVALLYDPRFHAAGPIVVLLTCAQLPHAILLTYDQVALSAGDSRRFFVVVAARALLQTGMMLAGLEIAGLLGALVGFGMAGVAAYPFYAWLAWRHRAWDPHHDALFAAISLVFGGLVLWMEWGALIEVGAF